MQYVLFTFLLLHSHSYYMPYWLFPFPWNFPLLCTPLVLVSILVLTSCSWYWVLALWYRVLAPCTDFLLLILSSCSLVLSSCSLYWVLVPCTVFLLFGIDFLLLVLTSYSWYWVLALWYRVLALGTEFLLLILSSCSLVSSSCSLCWVLALDIKSSCSWYRVFALDIEFLLLVSSSWSRSWDLVYIVVHCVNACRAWSVTIQCPSSSMDHWCHHWHRGLLQSLARRSLCTILPVSDMLCIVSEVSKVIIFLPMLLTVW